MHDSQFQNKKALFSSAAERPSSGFRSPLSPGFPGKKNITGVQTKLTVGDSSDPLEHEADRMADQVMGGSGEKLSSFSSPTNHHRNHSPAGTKISQATQADIQNPDGGEPLDTEAKSFMEARFAKDFGQVKLHSDHKSARMNRELGSRAFTHGNHIFFNQGKYRPASFEGRKLLAHELTHVVQQSSAPKSSPTVQRDEDKGTTPAHAGGNMGERDAAFQLGQKGFGIIIGPGGPGGHGLTEPGLDIVGYNAKSDELWIVDNKASGGTSTVQSATAITKNLEKNLESTLAQVRNMPAFPNKDKVVSHLERTISAVKNGTKMPPKVRIAVSSAGGYHSGVSKKLREQGIEFEDMTGSAVRNARKRDIKKAKAAGVKPGRPVRHNTSGSDTPEIPVPPPTTSTGSGSKRSGSKWGTGTQLGVIGMDIVAVPIVNHYLQKHYKPWIEKGHREMEEQSVAKSNPRFKKAIEQNKARIQKAFDEGKFVYLHYVIETGTVDSTDNDPLVGSGLSIGDVPYVKNVKDVQILLEGEKAKPYDPNNSWIGDTFRMAVGINLHYSSRRVQLEGTNMDVRKRKQLMETVEQKRGPKPVEFEKLILRSKYDSSAPTTDELRQYAKYKVQLTKAHPSGTAISHGKKVKYWKNMVHLVDAPIKEIITQAKIKQIPLNNLKAYALKKIKEAENKDTGKGAQSEAYWRDVLSNIDSSLEDKHLADQQRFIWKKGPGSSEIKAQEQKIKDLEARRDKLLKRNKYLATTDARSEEELSKGEPAYPPYSKMEQNKEEINRLNGEIELQKRLLKDSRKDKAKYEQSLR